MYGKNTAEYIYHAVNPVSPIMGKVEGSFSRLHEQIVMPAMELMVKNMTSTSRYDFNFPRAPLTNFVPVKKSMVEWLQLVDVNTRKTLTPRTKVRADQSGYIGEFLMPLRPNFRRIKDKGEGVELLPSAYLFGLYSPLERAACDHSHSA